MQLRTSCEFSSGFYRKTMPLQNREASKLLAQIGRRLIRRERLFLKKLAQLQATAAEPTAEYAARKRRDFGSTEKFVRTGEAKRALAGDSPALIVTPNGRTRSLTIRLKKMVDGVNVYNVAQLGLASSHENAVGRSLGSSRKRGRAVSALARGGKVRLATVKERLFDKPMTITELQPSDVPIVERVTREELATTFKKRGF